MRPTILRIAFGILAAGFTVFAGPQIPGIGSIEGVLVKVGTGEPIGGVNVEMRRVEGTAASPLGPLVFASGYTSPGFVTTPNTINPGDIFHVQTNRAGQFAFTNLKPGKYRLLAAHPGGLFYPVEYGQRSPRGAGYDFALEGAQSMRIRIEMAPMASVTGRVLGADGNPASHVHVMAAEIAYQNGARVLNQVQGVQTDDRGNYRLFWLPPGRYVIGAFPDGLRRRYASVAYAPPAAAESLNQTFSQALLLYTTNGSGEAVPETYETVYAPGETNPDLARVVDLRLGTSVTGIDISLASGRRRAVKISGVVIDSQTGQPAANANVRAYPLRGGPVIVAPTVTTDANGAFELAGLMQGSNYTVVASAGPNNSRRSAVQPIEVGGANIDGLRLVTTSGMTLSGRITIDGQETNDYRVGLGRDIAPFPSIAPANVANPGSFSISGVHPGDYRVNVTPVSPGAGQTAYIKSIRLGGADAATGEIRLDGNSLLDLEVALGRNAATVEGQVLEGQSPTANVIVVMIPADSRRADLFRTATTNTMGRFRIQGIAPGNYLAFAYPWLPAGSWQHPDFLNALRSRGKAVTLAEGSSASVSLALLTEVNF
jgi:hypothetical protein